MITPERVRAIACELLITASTTFRPDQVAAYRAAVAASQGPGRWVLEQLLANAEVAERERRPLCDDTGVPHLFLEVGSRAGLTSAHLAAMVQGVQDGLRMLPGREMGVRGGPQERVGSRQG